MDLRVPGLLAPPAKNPEDFVSPCSSIMEKAPSFFMLAGTGPSFLSLAFYLAYETDHHSHEPVVK